MGAIVLYGLGLWDGLALKMASPRLLLGFCFGIGLTPGLGRLAYGHMSVRAIPVWLAIGPRGAWPPSLHQDKQLKYKTKNIKIELFHRAGCSSPLWVPCFKELLMGSAPMGSARKRAFVKNVTFRVQTAPFDKITTDFWRSRRRLYIPDLLKAKKSGVRSTFF